MGHKHLRELRALLKVSHIEGNRCDRDERANQTLTEMAYHSHHITGELLNVHGIASAFEFHEFVTKRQEE
jgi:hypothetical protein